MSRKRKAPHQLTKDNYEQDNRPSKQVGKGFPKADAAVLKKRKRVKVRRHKNINQVTVPDPSELVKKVEIEDGFKFDDNDKFDFNFKSDGDSFVWEEDKNKIVQNLVVPPPASAPVEKKLENPRTDEIERGNSLMERILALEKQLSSGDSPVAAKPKKKEEKEMIAPPVLEKREVPKRSEKLEEYSIKTKEIEESEPEKEEFSVFDNSEDSFSFNFSFENSSEVPDEFKVESSERKEENSIIEKKADEELKGIEKSEAEEESEGNLFDDSFSIPSAFGQDPKFVFAFGETAGTFDTPSKLHVSLTSPFANKKLGDGEDLWAPKEGDDLEESDLNVGSPLPIPKYNIKEMNYEHTTGEEEEKTLHKCAAKIYVLDEKKETKESYWRERGIGEMKVNVPADKADDLNFLGGRLLMHRGESFVLLLNANIFEGFPISKIAKKKVTFTCVDYGYEEDEKKEEGGEEEEKEEEEPKKEDLSKSFLISFRSEEDCEKFLGEVRCLSVSGAKMERKNKKKIEKNENEPNLVAAPPQFDQFKFD